MDVNKLIESITVFDIGTLAILAGLVMAFTKGITETFKIHEGIHKQIMTVLMVVWLVLMTFLATVEQQAISFTLVLKLLSTIVIVFFGASGVYNLVPRDKIVEVDVTDMPDFEDIQADVTKEVDTNEELLQ